MKAATMQKHNDAVYSALQATLQGTYGLYFKTHSYHWNVTGPHFKGLHELFEEQYTDMWQTLDDLAERMRTLGYEAPRSLSEMGPDVTADKVKAEDMVKDLVSTQEALIETMKSHHAAVVETGDEATADIILARVQEHEKMTWMLKSSM